MTRKLLFGAPHQTRLTSALGSVAVSTGDTTMGDAGAKNGSDAGLPFRGRASEPSPAADCWRVAWSEPHGRGAASEERDRPTIIDPDQRRDTSQTGEA